MLSTGEQVNSLIHLWHKMIFSLTVFMARVFLYKGQRIAIVYTYMLRPMASTMKTEIGY